MISFTTRQNLYTSLSQNTSTANQTLGNQLMNIEDRYLLQKYFNNEGSFQITTVGTQSLTLTGSLSSGAIVANLSSVWTTYSTNATVTFSNGQMRECRFEKGSSAVYWDAPLTASATSVISVGGIQYYPAPPNYSKLKTVTINVGSLKYTPTEILSREEWDKLNVFPYYGDIPNNYFVTPGSDGSAKIAFWPIPATTGNVITFNYKYRVADLSLPDYSTGTVTASRGSTTLTFSGATLPITTNHQLESRWIQIPSPTGDNLWYQISSIDTTSSCILYQPYQGSNVTGASYIIGQMPILMEDFQDMSLWKALTFYFSSKVDNPTKRQEFQDQYDTKLKMLNEYAGQKTVHVNLGRRPPSINPNLFPQTIG